MENFKKALELEPDNESYKSNLQIAEDKVKSGVAPGGGMGGMFPGMGGGQWTCIWHFTQMLTNLLPKKFKPLIGISNLVSLHMVTFHNL